MSVNNELNEKNKKAASILKKAEEKVTSLESTIKTLTKEKANLTQYNDENTVSISALEKKVRQQKSVITDLHKQLQTMKQYIDQLTQSDLGDDDSTPVKGSLRSMVLAEMEKLGKAVNNL